ncbi:MAG: MerR family transcriptional regulator [Tepidisphaeraceae bacterium]
MYTIGEFSRITGLTVKTLRFYHDEGLLTAAFVDPGSGYRYYGENQAETARAIAALRAMEFPLEEIRRLLDSQQDDEQVLELLERHRGVLEERIRHLRKARGALRQFLQERQARAMASTEYEVVEKAIPGTQIAGIRMKGKYSDCGKAFGQICRKFGRMLCGQPMLLHFSTEYREDDADFEAAIPVRAAKEVQGITVRELPGGRCVSLIHQGPYDQLGRSYEKITRYVHEKGYKTAVPSRELYIKGPGMIFKGNPRNYLTEIQMMIEEA